MKIATWNMDFLRRASSTEKKEKLAAIFKDVDADIWVLTETNLAVSPGERYKPLCSDTLPDPKPYLDFKPGDHEVIIWCKHPMSKVSISESSTSVCAKVEISEDVITVYGTVIGVLGVKKGFEDDIDKQTRDWRSLTMASSRICVAGDFNVCWNGKCFPKLGRDKISDCLLEMELQNLTSGIEKNIDHIAISNAYQKTAECMWNLDKKLSDHIGVSVTVSLAEVSAE